MPSTGGGDNLGDDACGSLCPRPAVSRRRSAADTYPRQPGVDALHYVFRLALSDASSEITGETTITVKFLRDGVADLTLDLASLSSGTGMTVQSVRRGGPIDTPGPASDNIVFTHADNRLRLVLPPQSKAGQEFTFTIRYRGTPRRGLRIGDNMHGERTFFGKNWPNLVRHWLPMIDHPYDKATGEFIVTAPSHYQVVANGLLIEEIDLPNGLRRTHWKQSVPIASWLYTIGVARFSSHHAGSVDGVPMQTWVFPQDRDAGIAAVRGHRRAARCSSSSSHIGPYSVREARQRPGHRIHRRHRIRERDLLRREGRQLRPRPGGPRNRAPVVRRFGDRARLGRCVAERRVRDLLRAAVHRA